MKFNPVIFREKLFAVWGKWGQQSGKEVKWEVIPSKSLDWAENEGTRMNDIHSWGLQGRENFGEDIKGPRGAQQDMKAEVNDE